MKNSIKLFLIIAIGFLSQTSEAQTKSCCNTGATAEFAMLGNDANFQAAHLSPLPINFIPEKGEEVVFRTPDENGGKAFLVKSAKPSHKYLFVFHEWWGLNDYIRQEAERLAADFPDVNIMALDLYDGLIANDAQTAERIMQQIKNARAEAIIKGAITYIGDSAIIQTLGWCFGGGWSLQAALLSGKQMRGCVMYYGMPEKDANRLATLNGPVLGIFASRDGWINKPLIEEFEKQMKFVKKPLEVHWFDAEHAFANPSNPQFDKDATASAKQLVNAFLEKNWKRK